MVVNHFCNYCFDVCLPCKFMVCAKLEFVPFDPVVAEKHEGLQGPTAKTR
jgi:hypothetical protein